MTRFTLCRSFSYTARHQRQQRSDGTRVPFGLGVRGADVSPTSSATSETRVSRRGPVPSESTWVGTVSG